LRKLEEGNRSIALHDANKQARAEGVQRFFRAGQKLPPGWEKYRDVFTPPTADFTEFYDKEQMEGLEKVARDLGVDVKTVSSGPAGQAFSADQSVHRRVGTAPDVLAHEIGHQIDFKYNLRDWLKEPVIRYELSDLAEARAANHDLEALSDKAYKYATDPHELMATLIQGYLHAPELTSELAPDAVAKLEEFFGRHEELKPLLDVKPSLVLGKRTQKLRLAGPVLAGQWAMPKEANQLVKNLEAPGLMGRAGIAGKLYDAVRTFGNQLNMFQLGWSGFHWTAEGINAVVSSAALGLEKASAGKGGLREILSAPAAPWRTYRGGKSGEAEYLNPGSQAGAVGDVVNALGMGGFRLRQNIQDVGDHAAKFLSALRQLQGGTKDKSVIAQAVANALPALNEFVSKPLMEKWVPRLKLGAAMEMARFELERLGPDADPATVRASMAKIVDSVDNRFGQLAYDNLFWNRAFKDVMTTMFRSTGWNLGTWRELGGAVKDVPGSVKGLAAGAPISHRLAYTVALVGTTGIMGALAQYLMTGKGPKELRDYFFPRTGNKRKDGTDDRLSFPTYIRDVAALIKRGDEGPWRLQNNAANTFVGKLHPAIALMNEIGFKNEDFYGRAIRNPADSTIQQSIDVGKHLLDSYVPFSLRQKPGAPATPRERLANFAGVTPAPAYVTRSWEQQRQREQKQKVTLTPLMRRKKQP
jgi:hypothetical protein